MPGRRNDRLQCKNQDLYSLNSSEIEKKTPIPTRKQASSSLYQNASAKSRNPEKKTPVSVEQDPPPVVMHRFRSLDDLLRLISIMNAETKDNRPKGGSLWIQSNPNVDWILNNAVVLNADEIEIYPKRVESCKAFDGAPGWYIY